MTVTYTAEVATCSGLGCFWKLLFRWRGSIYKLLWPNLIAYSGIYFALSIIYRFTLSNEHRILFEKISLHCREYGDLIPIAFVLGFYVSIVIKRWWDQYICIPWPDNLAMFVSTLIHGQDDRGRMMRRTIIRYVNLCLVLTLRMMSPCVKKRFPTLDHLVEAGFLQPNEKKIFDHLDQKTSHPKYWMPLVWAGGIVTRARKEGRIKDDFSVKTLIDGLNAFRGGCGGMLNYDWISIPLVYTQVVTLAVYTYFMATLMGNQFLDPTKHYSKHEVDLVVPVFTFLQFFFYMGWLKVAESLVNPFGEDDDDFELNWLVDRNLQVSYVIVDEMHQEHPEMVKDQYWDEVFPAELPYTAATKQYNTGPPTPSTDNVEVPLEEAEFMPLESITEASPEDTDDLVDIEVEDDSGSGDKSTRKESHPMKIIKGKKLGSLSTIHGSSFSVTRSGHKNSILSMLTKLFRREEPSKDMENQLGSSVSLPGRKGVRSFSRMSSISHSQAQSRTSIVRENTIQDEMFHMSDVSLDGSAGSESSQIQIMPPRDHKRKNSAVNIDNDKDTESSEATHLVSSFRSTPRKISFSKERERMQQQQPPDSPAEQKKPLVHQNSSNESAAYESPGDKMSEELSPLKPRKELMDASFSPSAFIDPFTWNDPVSITARVVMPSSPPIRHTFTPIFPAIYSSSSKESKVKTVKADDYGKPRTSSLSRSVRQHQSVFIPDSANVSSADPVVTLLSPVTMSVPKINIIKPFSEAETKVDELSVSPLADVTDPVSSHSLNIGDGLFQAQEQLSQTSLTNYVPSAAIPVPSTSHAHDNMEEDTEQPNRRFSQLEPIIEHAETAPDSPRFSSDSGDIRNNCEKLAESTV